jgi:hypothetical protein
MFAIKAEVSKVDYSSKANSSNVHYFALPIGTVITSTSNFPGVVRTKFSTRVGLILVSTCPNFHYPTTCSEGCPPKKGYILIFFTTENGTN